MFGAVCSGRVRTERVVPTGLIVIGVEPGEVERSG